ncbi:MAG: PorV/PorQ family protein [Saprospiraceae bacterium]|nr:PorV/PorQ family protein [Saprospiraceae bacterium]MDW8483393.1 PorV/PorQ family protein [Saprospiraceae bacterium]
MKNIPQAYLLLALLFTFSAAQGGNPDRQGEAGAGQLLINPWARSAGLHSLNTSSVTSIDAIFLNVAGLPRFKGTQIALNHTRYLEGAEMALNALGFAQRVGRGALGISLVSFDIGDLRLTTADTPEGSGATFSPAFFNLSLAYGHLFENRVSVGVAAKFVSESIPNAGASAIALDAGVQYVTGENDNFKFGISLRNVGSKMRFRGEGLGVQNNSTNPTFNYPITFYQRSAEYELPSQLNIGVSYDWLLGRHNRLSLLGTFTSNAFARDQVGAGLEFFVGQFFILRAAYKIEFDPPSEKSQATLDNGLSAGFTFSTAFKKGGNGRLSVDYGYRNTNIFRGIHNLGLRIDF